MKQPKDELMAFIESPDFDDKDYTVAEMTRELNWWRGLEKRPRIQKNQIVWELVALLDAGVLERGDHHDSSSHSFRRATMNPTPEEAPTQGA